MLTDELLNVGITSKPKMHLIKHEIESLKISSISIDNRIMELNEELEKYSKEYESYCATRNMRSLSSEELEEYHYLKNKVKPIIKLIKDLKEIKKENKELIEKIKKENSEILEEVFWKNGLI